MDKVKLENWNGLNFEKIKERARELETFPSYIPSVFTSYINMRNRLEFLKKNNLYDNVQKEKKKHRDNLKKTAKNKKSETRKQDIIDWINNNLEFIDLINLKE